MGLIKHSSELTAEPTSHGSGHKVILIQKEGCVSNLIQAALSVLVKGERVPAHRHLTMEEFYFIQEGELVLELDGVS